MRATAPPTRATDPVGAATDEAERRPPDPHDVRLVPAALATWLAVGIGLGTPTWVGAVAAGVSGVGAVLAVRGARVTARPVGVLLQLALVMGGIAAGAAVVTLHHLERSDQPLSVLAADGSTVVVQGTVLTDPDDALRGHVRVRIDLIAAGPQDEAAPAPARGTVMVTAPPGDGRLRIGERIETHGDAVETGRAEEDLAMIYADEPPVTLAAPTGVLGAIDGLREGLRTATAPLDAQARGLVPGIALGDDRAMPPDLQDAARVTGLTHLTAVSGAHVSLVLAGVIAVVGRGRPRLAAVAGVAVVLALVVLVRPEPSVLRAGATGAVVLLAGLLGRPARALPALSVAVVVLLLSEPTLARSYGLVLSAAATAAIVVGAEPVARMFSRGVPRWLARGLAVPAVAQLACGPVLVLLDARLALTAVPANLLAGPAVPGATMLGLGAALAAPVSPELAELLVRVASWHTAWIAWVARTLAAAPAATVPWPAGAVGLALMVAATVVVALLAARWVTTAVRVRALVVVALLPGAVGAVPVPVGTGSPQGWAVLQCDVGQASALLVRTGETSAVLVDAGEVDGRAAVCLQEAGIETLDAVVLTHDHADHTGGFAAVLAVAEVREVVVPAVEGPSPAEDAAAALAAHGGDAQVREVVAGQRLDWPGVGATVLHPRAGARASPDSSSSVNESSVALLIEVPRGEEVLTVLVAGDLEEAGQRRLTRALGQHGAASDGVDVVVVPHHGSGNLHPGLATATRPAVALVSAGQDNDHGHPAPRTLELWSGTGARVARADECGHIWLVPGRGGALTLVGCD